MLGFCGTKRSGEDGFTLIELMVVVVIIGILASILVTNVMGRVEKAKESRSMMDLDAIATACRIYKLDNDEGKWPQSLNDLIEYGISADAEDPWGGEYRITPEHDNLKISARHNFNRWPS